MTSSAHGAVAETAPPLAPAYAAPSGAAARRLFFAVFPSIMLPMFLASIDGTIVASALPRIAGSLGDVERVSWVMVSYLLAATIAAPVYGRLGDVLGRRRMLFSALTIMLIAHLWCAAATSLTMLVLARILQGLGGLMTLSQSLIGEIVPPRERGRYQGYNASVFVTSSLIGPVAGGWLTQRWGWPSVFLALIPLIFVAMALALRLPAHRGGQGRFHFDFIGTVLFALFIAPALMALEQAQHFSRAALPGALGLGAVAVISLVLLLRQESRTASPLLPVQFLRQSAVWRTDALAACAGAVIVSLVTFLPIFLAVARGTEPGHIGLLMLPLTGLVAVGSMITGRMVSNTGRTALWPSLGMPVLAGLLALLAVLAPGISLDRLPWLLGAIALFMGCSMPVVQVTVQMLAGPKQLGAAAASVQFSRSIGAAAGTALVGTVLFATLAATDGTAAALFGRIVEQGPAALAGLDAARLAVVQGEIATAFRAAFLTIAAFALAGGAFAWSIPVRRIE
jgi:MFS family permease